MKLKNSFSHKFFSLGPTQNNYSRKSYYQNYLSKYQDGQFYLGLIKKVKNNSAVKTNIEIRLFENKKLNEINIKDIVRKFGKPRYNIICKKLLGIKIMLFKQNVGAHKTKLEFHFKDEILFFYSYTFSNINNVDKNEIIQIIQDKYLDKGSSYEKVNRYIIDKSNNIIFLNDDIRFSIYYLCDNKVDLEQIQKFIYLQKEEKQIAQETNRKVLHNIL
jgi:hypothetical protein